MTTPPIDRAELLRLHAASEAASGPHHLTSVLVCNTDPEWFVTVPTPLLNWPREVVERLADGQSGEQWSDVTICGTRCRSLLFGDPGSLGHFRRLAAQAAEALDGRLSRTLLPSYLTPSERWVNALRCQFERKPGSPYHSRPRSLLFFPCTRDRRVLVDDNTLEGKYRLEERILANGLSGERSIQFAFLWMGNLWDASLEFLRVLQSELSDEAEEGARLSEDRVVNRGGEGAPHPASRIEPARPAVAMPAAAKKTPTGSSPAAQPLGSVQVLLSILSI